MALEKRKRLGQIEVLEDGTMFVKEYNEILDDGVVISSVPHRTPITPLEDVSTNEHKMVRDIAEKLWTPELKAKYIASENKKKSNLA